MKLDFTPRLELTWVAVGIGGASLIEGGIQAISGGAKAKKARNAISGLQTPGYTPNKAINDYYQAALNRYNAGPYNSLQYQNALKGANTAYGAGINASQDRRSGNANIGALTAQYNNNLQRAGAQAEQTQKGNFSQLGQAANAQSGESRFDFQQNQLAPYQKSLQLDYAQLGGANNLVSAGLSNINSGIQTAGLAAMRQNSKYQQGYGGYGY